MRALVVVLGLVAACGGDGGPFTIVTIQARPAVHDVADLKVALTNGGTSREDTFQVNSKSFPATFSITAPGRTGDLDIAIEAHDRDGNVVGNGAAVTTIESAAATIMLETADFVVNTDVAMDQFPSNDFDANGFQISASPDGLWTVVYRDDCNSPCNMFARRFDVDARAVDTAIAAGSNGFPISTNLTIFSSTPAVATSGNTTVAVWDFSEPSPSTTDGIACRSLDAAGNPAGDQVTVSIETSPDVVSVTALQNGSFAITWTAFGAAEVIRGAIVDGQCTPSGVVNVSTLAGSLGPSRSAVASNGDKTMYVWVLDGNARGRVMSNTNAPVSADIPLVAKTATEEIQYVRVAPFGDGFAVAVRWVLSGSSMGAGRIEVYRTDAGGALKGGPTVVTTRSGSDFQSSESFGLAHRTDDGALLVVWHSCGDNGDDSGCGVFGRVMRPSGVPVGDEFSLATTTDQDQTDPSAVGLPGAFATTWMDMSQKAPDKSGAAVRARVVYPPYNDATRVIGAQCTASADCDPGLLCGPATDGGKRCFASCVMGGPPPQCPEGGSCNAADGGSACLF